MENLWLAAAIAGVTLLALFRLRQMLHWVPAEAIFLGFAKPLPWWGGTYTGQPLPISFRLPDGTPVRAALRNAIPGGPRVGERLRIRYHPRDPERVAPASAVPLLALLVAALLYALVVVLRRSLRDAGLMA